MAGRDRSRAPGRASTPKPPNRSFLIFCEGKVTEPQYLGHLARACPKVRVTWGTHGAVPLTLVERAVKHRRQNSTHTLEEVWCVFDCDEHPNLNQAFVLARDHGVKVAFSNPCFELWLLLHLRDSPGARHRHDLQQMLAKLLPGYERDHKHLDVEKLLPGLEGAERRAARLEQDAGEAGEERRNPSTSAYRLTRAFRS
jgi:hypothetical protein